MKYIIYQNDKEFSIENNLIDCFDKIKEWCKKHNRYYDIFGVDKIMDFGKDAIIIKIHQDDYQRHYVFKIKVNLEVIN